MDIEMHSHEPPDYNCPYCRLVRGDEDEINRQDYIAYEDDSTLAFVAPKWWINNPGHVLVVPKAHVENIYDIPDALLGDVYKTVKKIATAVRAAYPAEGTSTRQHNEPAGYQDVWHFHVHVYPRYAHDGLYRNDDKVEWVDHQRRMYYVEKLKAYVAGVPTLPS